MANYITTDTTDPNQTNIRMTTNLMIGADSDPAQELHVTGDGVFTGNITAYYSSDISLKDNIRPIESAIFKVKQIRGVTFDWNEKSNKLQQEKGHDVGLIAQEVLPLEQSLGYNTSGSGNDQIFVGGGPLPVDNPEEVDDSNRENAYTMGYEKFIMPLINAVKELDAENTALKSRVTTLEGG